jgi:mRNA interferase HigB
LGNGIVIFNIKGNDYRLIVDMMYAWQVVFVLLIGTHAEYDRLSDRDIHALKKPKP